MGPLILDLQGTSLTDEERELLRHPLVAGVILFSRNYESPEQLHSFIQSIRAASTSRLLISVDQEGGRVQRFKHGFTLIPPAQSYAALYPLDMAKNLAFDAGWLMATELLAYDIDISFAPVLDLGHDCLAIGSRSFHQEPNIALSIATAMIDGMHLAGMKTTGKHFPGHGAVIADSHKETPIDDRTQDLILQDMQIFSQLIHHHKLDAIMPAHVIYPAFDNKPASGSSYWLKSMLRDKLNFDGVIFSDDLSMEGAAILGTYHERAEAVLQAGCDILLACNNRQGSIEILTHLKTQHQTTKASTLLHSTQIDMTSLKQQKAWQIRRDKLLKLNDDWQQYLERK